MTQSSFAKILRVLDLFSLQRPVINVDLISRELGLSKPTSYRYLKELVAAELLQRVRGTAGDYTLGSKIAVLDYISRITDPLVQISIPHMQTLAERTESCCLLTHLNYDSCIDLHHEILIGSPLLSYGRGCPRPIYLGSSPKVMMAYLAKQKQLDYYHRFQHAFAEVGFATSAEEFLKQMKAIKKQGFYFSNGELDPHIAGLSVPVHFSSKEPPLALTLLASKSRFEFANVDKLVDILKEHAHAIEQVAQQAETL